MSDFDKEAEREKLREKYERDKKEREATQRMSDLLLKGATMTNTHCDVCGDPIFRMNGTSFCPSCHGGPDAVEGSAPAGGGEQGGAADGDEGTANASETAGTGAEESPEPTAESGTATEPAPDRSVERPSASNTRAADAADATPDASSGSGADARSPDRAAGGTDRGRGRNPAGAGNDRSPADGNARPSDRPSIPDAGGDIEAARDSLRRALERFSREAAESDDPRHARACLEAAREAAETLSALRR